EQGRLVDLVRDLRDHDLEAVAALGLFDEGLGADDDTTTAGRIRRLDTLETEDGASGREVRPRYDFEELFQRNVRVVDERRERVANLGEIVRRDIGRHADRNTGATVNQQVRQSSRQHGWLHHRVVVVRHLVDGLLVDV